MQRLDQLWYHAIWATKNREPVLDANHFKRVYELCKQREKEWQFFLDSINGYLDHVHILIQIHPSQPVAKVIGWIKGSSSHAFGEGFEWQSGYSIVTVSPTDLGQLKQYILSQQELHQAGSLSEALELPHP